MKYCIFQKLAQMQYAPGRVHGGYLVIRELTPEQKTSAKFAINIQSDK
jgi:hypothetical protein